MKKKKLEAKLSETKKKLVKTRSKLKELQAVQKTEATEVASQPAETLSPSNTDEIAPPQKPARTRVRKS